MGKSTRDSHKHEDLGIAHERSANYDKAISHYRSAAQAYANEENHQESARLDYKASEIEREIQEGDTKSLSSRYSGPCGDGCGLA